MEEYDLIVVGSGAGMNVASRARQRGMKVAILENGPMGGTCLNRGCIPSKILLYPADVVRQIGHAEKLGIHAKITKIDFNHIRKRMWDLVLEDRRHMERGSKSDHGLDAYRTTGYFVSEKVIRVGDKDITAPRIMIAGGARTKVPNVSGLEDAKYLTSETVFDIKSLPKSIVILGGGYIGCEFAHFFSSMGVDVTLVGHNVRLLPSEEPEASALVKKVMSRHVDVHVNKDTLEVKSTRKGKEVALKDRATGRTATVAGEEILVATGVKSNADILKASKGNITLDPRGYIVVNEYLETNVPGVWAFGDIIGRNMFRHTANYESDVAWNNAFNKNKRGVDEHAVPHAVFTYPQVAGVGLTQEETKKKNMKILVGTGSYNDCAKGYAMAADDSFIKVILDSQSLRILGASFVGPSAALMVQPLVYLMNAGDGSYMPLVKSQIIHPALSEALTGAFNSLRDPDATHGPGHAHSHSSGKDHSH